MSGDADAIRAVVADWCDATREGDIDRVLALMTDDVLFLVPGAPPMQGRKTFAAGLRGAPGTCCRSFAGMGRAAGSWRAMRT